MNRLEAQISQWQETLIPSLLQQTLEQEQHILETVLTLTQRLAVLRTLLLAMQEGLVELADCLKGDNPRAKPPSVVARCPYCLEALGTFPLVTQKTCDLGKDTPSPFTPIEIDNLDELVIRWFDWRKFRCSKCDIEFRPLLDEERSGQHTWPNRSKPPKRKKMK